MSKDQGNFKINKISSNVQENDDDIEEVDKEKKVNEKKSKETEKKDKTLTAQDEYMKMRKTIYDKLRLSELGWKLHENSQYSKSKLRKLFYSGDDNALDYKFCLEFDGSDPWAAYEDEKKINANADDI